MRAGACNRLLKRVALAATVALFGDELGVEGTHRRASTARHVGHSVQEARVRTQQVGRRGLSPSPLARAAAKQLAHKSYESRLASGGCRTEALAGVRRERQDRQQEDRAGLRPFEACKRARQEAFSIPHVPPELGPTAAPAQRRQPAREAPGGLAARLRGIARRRKPA